MIPGMSVVRKKATSGPSPLSSRGVIFGETEKLSMSESITGVAVLGNSGETIVFIPPTSRTPTKIVRHDDRLVISDTDGAISDETYGPLALEKCQDGATVFVIEMDKAGEHGRGFQLVVGA
jgi:hypothetical protein